MSDKLELSRALSKTVNKHKQTMQEKTRQESKLNWKLKFEFRIETLKNQILTMAMACWRIQDVTIKVQQVQAEIVCGHLVGVNPGASLTTVRFDGRAEFDSRFRPAHNGDIRHRQWKQITDRETEFYSSGCKGKTKPFSFVTIDLLKSIVFALSLKRRRNLTPRAAQNRVSVFVHFRGN